MQAQDEVREARERALVDAIGRAWGAVGAHHRELLRLILEAAEAGVWRDWGARDPVHWVSMRLGISYWKAQRWLWAARALESLPLVSEALVGGELSIDKVVELARFATPEDEARLVAWAGGVSVGAIRRRGDLALARSVEPVREAHRSRSLSWWYHEDRTRFGLQAELPAAEGAVVARAIDRLAERVPAMPGEEDGRYLEARRADALVALASARLGQDPDPDRATVVVHAAAEALSLGDRGAEVEGGGVIHPETARRLLCNARVQALVEDGAGNPIRVGRLTREPPAWMLRQFRQRDRECRFPGCGTRWFTQAHHVVWWERGGPTDLHNLVLVCGFHHRLVHEHGWRIRLGLDGGVRWYRPDGGLFRSGPAPPRPTRERLGHFGNRIPP
ncbi:MAG: DUF222 domain-containing protein [Actinobacteria bacterium]|nr:DUF222 domain-containing protein [Actinomycetota bacterium]